MSFAKSTVEFGIFTAQYQHIRIISKRVFCLQNNQCVELFASRVCFKSLASFKQSLKDADFSEYLKCY